MSTRLTVALRDNPPNQLVADAHHLAVFTFGAPHPGAADVPLQPLESDTGCEVWTVDAPVTTGQDGDIHWRASDDLLFAWCHVADQPDAHALARTAYDHLLAWIATRGPQRILRVWNYLSDINAGVGDDERYRQFCVGRQAAFDDAPALGGSFPAATAISAETPGLTLMVLAARQAATMIENPRQVSAYAYPREYGPQSPSFSRAARWPGPPRLLLASGTASVVGHASMHVGDPEAQLRETLANLSVLCDEAGLPQSRGVFRLYLRDPAAWRSIAPVVADLRARGHGLVALAGDICRRELLVEAEAVFTQN